MKPMTRFGVFPKRWRALRTLLAALITVSLLVVGFAFLAEAAPSSKGAEEGEVLFQEKCAACHTIGGGDLVGPDLQGVTARRDAEWLARWILEPDEMLGEGDPIATQLLQEYNNVPMPNLGLTEAEVAAILLFLEAPPGAPAEAPAEATAVGDPILGKDLFTGVIRFENGGPGCMACHSIAGIGALGGGALGPDLTEAYSKYGDALITWPDNVLPMRAIYVVKPLTPEEKANLLTFVQAASVAQRPAQAVGQLILLTAAGAIVLLALSHLFWRRRLREVRRPLVGRTTSGARSTN